MTFHAFLSFFFCEHTKVNINFQEIISYRPTHAHTHMLNFNKKTTKKVFNDHDKDVDEVRFIVFDWLSMQLASMFYVAGANPQDLCSSMLRAILSLKEIIVAQCKCKVTLACEAMSLSVCTHGMCESLRSSSFSFSLLPLLSL